MGAVPGGIDVGEQPPMTIPLRHFLVGLGFLILGGLVGLGSTFDVLGSSRVLAHVHVLLVGWVCITIMGAMTQFVPVWSGVSLHSRGIAVVQLWLVGVGLLGFVGALLGGFHGVLPVAGGAILVGFWAFVYNIGRTLRSAGAYDVTERHFAIALGFFVVLSSLGLLLAADFVIPLLSPRSVERTAVVDAHATLAMFGAVLTTVFGALYQLVTMFTQTELHGIDVPLGRFEEVGYPIGVILLATGRLWGRPRLAIVGGLLVVVSMLVFSVILLRRLYETQVEWTPMMYRYAVLAVAMILWALLAVPFWVRNPLDEAARFGAPGTVHLLAMGVVGFVVLGTLYHIVPFIVWVHRYSDRLGYEPVPMIDDLYSDRIARADFWCFVTGTILVVLADLTVIGRGAAAVGGTILLLGTLLFVWNIGAVIRSHSPHSVTTILLGERTSDPRTR